MSVVEGTNSLDAEGGKSSESVILSQAEIVRRIPVLAGFVSTFDPYCAISVPIAAVHFTSDLLRQPQCQHLPLFFINVLSRDKDDHYQVSEPHSLPDLQGRRVLLLDSCRDSGMTLALTKQFLVRCGVEQIMSLVAVDKNQPNCVSRVSGSLFKMDGKSNPFIYGYGMDDNDGTKRGLPYVATRDPIGGVNAGQASK